MATPAMEATTALRNLHLTLIDIIYPMNLPSNTDGLTKKTVALVTETGQGLGTPGNDGWHSRADGIQVQVFYAAGFSSDPEALEGSIIRGLKSAGYRAQLSSGPHTVDPDTRQLTATLKFEKTKGVSY